MALEIGLKEGAGGLAIWEKKKKQGWPHGNSLEGVEYRATTTESV